MPIKAGGASAALTNYAHNPNYNLCSLMYRFTASLNTLILVSCGSVSSFKQDPPCDAEFFRR